MFLWRWNLSWTAEKPVSRQANFHLQPVFRFICTFTPIVFSCCNYICISFFYSLLNWCQAFPNVSSDKAPIQVYLSTKNFNFWSRFVGTGGFFWLASNFSLGYRNYVFIFTAQTSHYLYYYYLHKQTWVLATRRLNGKPKL